MDIFSEDLIKLAIAILLGSIIGAEREYRSKSAGFRTHILVCVGSTLFTIFSIRIGAPNNIDRIAANIITGIGFLGAGAIFRGDAGISGLTTATTIWMSAALGMGVGSGEYILCSIASVAILTVLFGFTILEKIIDTKHQTRNYRIECEFKDETLYHYEKIFEECGLKARRGRQSKEGNRIIGTWNVQGSEKDHETLTEKLLNDREILSFDHS